MKILNTYIRFFLIGFVGFTTITTSTIDADAVDIWGSVQVCAFPLNCIGRYTPAASGYGPYIYDTETLLGPGNNWAESEYLGDISKGFVGGWARATRGYDIVRDVWCPASASTFVGWQAAIDFRVEPGSYPDGLIAIATVVAKGRLSKYGTGTQAIASYYASFGEDYYYSGSIALESYHPDQALIIDEEFTLTAILIPPGTILENHRIVEIPITAGLGTPSGPPLIASTWAGGIFEAGAMSDFAFQKYLRFISISVPPEVTWISTDEFLTMPIDACRGDFDKDGDVDSSDLSELTSDIAQLDLKLFAVRFGRSDCQPW